MKNFEAQYGKWVLKHRWLIVFLTLLMVAVAGSGGKHLEFTTNYRVFFSPDNPELMAFQFMEDAYAKNDNAMIVLAPHDGNVFSNRTLAAVEKLTEKAWQTPYSSRVDSISNFQYTEAEEDDLVVRDLYQNAMQLSAEQIAKVRDIATTEPILLNRLVSDRQHVTAVNITIQLPGKNEAEETPQVASFVRGLVDEVRAENPDMDVYLTGMVMLNNAFGESSKNDMKLLVPVSFALMLLCLGILIKGITGTIGTALVILFSIISAMGAGGYIGFPLSPPSVTAPTIILTVAIANCVHVLVAFLYGYKHGLSKNEALVESLRLNLQPVFIASLTTAIGFLSMNFSEVPPFRHLGNFVAMGVVASFIFSVTFLPAFISLLPVKVPAQVHGKDTPMLRLGQFVVRHHSKLLWGMALLVIVLVSSITRNEMNDVFVHYFEDSIQFRTDSDFTTANLTGLYSIEYSLESGEAGGISNPEFLQQTDQFADWYRAQPETMHVAVITDTMKRLNKNMHGDDPVMYQLPDERNLAAQYLLLYEMSLPYGLDLNNQITVDKASTRMVVSLQTISSNEVLALEQRAQVWLTSNAAAIKQANGTGTTPMFAHIGSRNITSMLMGTTIALVFISFVLVFAFRSLTIGLISLVPNLIPAALGFGLWGIIDGEVGLALSVVTGMTLGIVVDDTVHFLSKYLRARRENGLNSRDAVIYAFSTVGRALIITSVVLVVGFLVLSLSSFELNSGMGLLTAIVIAFALAADFLFLPPLLIKIEEYFHEKLVAANANP